MNRLASVTAAGPSCGGATTDRRPGVRNTSCTRIPAGLDNASIIGTASSPSLVWTACMTSEDCWGSELAALTSILVSRLFGLLLSHQARLSWSFNGLSRPDVLSLSRGHLLTASISRLRRIWTLWWKKKGSLPCADSLTKMLLRVCKYSIFELDGKYSSTYIPYVKPLIRLLTRYWGYLAVIIALTTLATRH